MLVSPPLSHLGGDVLPALVPGTPPESGGIGERAALEAGNRVITLCSTLPLAPKWDHEMFLLCLPRVMRLHRAWEFSLGRCPLLLHGREESGAA